MYIALLIYITIIALITSIATKRDEGRKIFVWLSFIAIGLLIGFRSTSVGADTANYYRLYGQIKSINYDSDLEKGYILLVVLFNKITDNPQIVFIFQGLLVAISCSCFVNKNTNKLSESFIAVLAFLAFNLFTFHLSGVRQSIAMSICLFAYEKIKDKKLISFLILVLIATLFHVSAIFFIPAYFIGNIKDGKALIVSVIVTVLGILFLERIMNAFSLLNDRFSKYGIEETDNGYIFFLIIMFITIFDLVFRKSILNNTKTNQVHSKVNYCSAGMWVMRLFTRVIERINFFYLPSTIIVLSNTHGSLKPGSDKKLFIIILSFLLMFLYYYRIHGLVYSFC